jgi:hypothetical protein
MDVIKEGEGRRKRTLAARRSLDAVKETASKEARKYIFWCYVNGLPPNYLQGRANNWVPANTIDD